MAENIRLRALHLRPNHNNNSLVTPPQRAASFVVPNHAFNNNSSTNANIQRSASHVQHLSYNPYPLNLHRLNNNGLQKPRKPRIKKRREHRNSTAGDMPTSLPNGYALPRLVGTKLAGGYSIQNQPLLASNSFSSTHSYSSRQLVQANPEPSLKHHGSFSLQHSNSYLSQHPSLTLQNHYAKPAANLDPQGSQYMQSNSLTPQRYSPHSQYPPPPSLQPQSFQQHLATSYSPRQNQFQSYQQQTSYQPAHLFHHSPLTPSATPYPNMGNLSVSSPNLHQQTHPVLPSYPSSPQLCPTGPPLPSFPSHLPTSPHYTSLARLQPPEGATYREPPMLNDKLFPRDAAWNEDGVGVSGTIGPGNMTSGLHGTKGPHLQVRGLMYDRRSSKDRSLLLDGVSFEAKGGEILAVMATDGEYQ